MFKTLFTPNKIISSRLITTIALLQAMVVMFLWFLYPSPIIPKPHDIIGAVFTLWSQGGLVHALLSSVIFNIEALLLSTAFSLSVAYLTVIPFFKPLGSLISKGRFLGLAGLTFLFILLIKETHSIKLAMLTFGMSVFFVTGMVDVVKSISPDQLDYARTLRMGEWHIVWEVVILGTLDKAMELMRQNAAIGWVMLAMVEGMFRSEGGIGVMLLNQDKYLRLDNVLAIQLCIFTLGIAQDTIFGYTRKFFCPHVMALEKKGS